MYVPSLPFHSFTPTLKQENGWMSHVSISTSAAITFSDLPKEEGEAWVKKMPHHSATSFAGYAAYKDIPVSYLLCEEDLVIPAKVQRDEIELIEKESGKKVDVMGIKTGHCPIASAPEKVIDWILDMAEKGLGQ
jgi:hypothetical protein